MVQAHCQRPACSLRHGPAPVPQRPNPTHTSCRTATRFRPLRPCSPTPPADPPPAPLLRLAGRRKPIVIGPNSIAVIVDGEGRTLANAVRDTAWLQ